MKSGKVWGHTSDLLKTPFCEVHAIEVNPWSKCSKHKHNHKYNLFYVTLGELLIRVWKNNYALVDETLLQKGQWTVVNPGEFHEFETMSTPCEALEVYYPEGISDDIIREGSGSRTLTVSSERIPTDIGRVPGEFIIGKGIGLQEPQDE